MPTENSSTIALITPPFFLNDFKSPYLAMPHLAGFMRQNGVNDIDMIDANMLMWQVLRSPCFLRETADRLSLRWSKKDTLNDYSEREALYYRFLLDYLCDRPERLVEEADTINLYAGVIFDLYYSSVRRSIPAQIEAIEHGTAMPRLQEVADSVVANLSNQTKLVALTVPTADQFMPALLLAKAAKQRFGASVTIALGGCIFSLLNRIKAFEALQCRYVDCIGVHEGEHTMVALAEHVQTGRALSTIPNLLYTTNGQVCSTKVEPAPPLNDCPEPYFPPNYLQAYGPDPRLPVWASRGCYWGKCTFCDYIHLSANGNNAETIRAQRLADTVELLSSRHEIKSFELITECLSPSFSRRFSADVVSRELDIEWTTHIKIEKSFDLKTCKIMRASGCQRVTIGVESFNDRQLMIMKKGCTRDDIVAMLRNLTVSGVKPTINIIVDFPSVTNEEAEETLQALHHYRHLYCGLNVFPFVLSLLTDIAKAPSEFGVAVDASPDEAHNRGFHFTKFERAAGIDKQQADDWLRRYQMLGFGHKRSIAAEISDYWLDNAQLEELTLQRSERLQLLDGPTARRLAEVQLVDRFDPDQEVILFDLERKRAVPCAVAVATLIENLPSKPITLDQILEMLGLDVADADSRDFFRNLISYVAQSGLATISAPEKITGSNSDTEQLVSILSTLSRVHTELR